MLYLLLAILTSVAVAHTLKYAEHRKLAIYPVYAVNYLIATGIALYGGGGQLPPSMGIELGIVGVIMGFLFIGCFVLFSYSIRKLGVSIAVSLMRLAAVLPTIASLLFFDDLPAALQVIGIILAFAALPFATKQPIGRDWKVLVAGGFGWGLLLFFAFGLVEFLFKIQKELLPVENSYQFLSLIFPIAFLTAVVLVVVKKQRIGLHELGAGAVLGVVNFFSAYFFVLALKELPGVFVYPTNGVAIILLTTVTGILFWKERVTKRNMVFIAIASLALALLYQG